MRKGIVILLLLCFVSCGKDLPEVPETDVPETVLQEEPPRIAPPEEMPTLAAHAEEVPPAEIISDGQDDGIENPVREVIVPEPSFSPAEVAVSRFGDMEMDPEGEHISLGGDLDGCDQLPAAFSGVQDYPKLSTKLLERGLDEKTVRNIFWNNAVGVIR